MKVRVTEGLSKPSGVKDGDRAPHVVARGLILAALLVTLCVLVRTNTVSLLAWTERCFSVALYPPLFAAYFGTWLLLRVTAPRFRRAALFVGSIATAAVFDAAFLILSLVWIVAFHRILFPPASATPRIRLALVFVIATYLALGIAASYDLFPAFLERHPFVARWGYVFACSFTFRIAWLLHEVRMKRARMPLVDVVLYFIFAPFFVIVPYMIAIPRCDRFRAGLSRHDTAIERSGLRLIGWGIVLSFASWLLVRYYDPKTAFIASLQRREIAHAVAHSLFYYPIAAVLYATSIAAILVGMVRVLGIDLGPSFDRPLLATTITDWWRRWNMHFRELLVDIFYYPVLLERRRTPVKAIVIGCVLVFVVGSTLLHLPKHYFRWGTIWPPELNLLVENTVMCAIVMVALVRQRRRRPDIALSPMRRALCMIRTWTIVMVTVVYVGYGSQLLVQSQLTPTPRWATTFTP